MRFNFVVAAYLQVRFTPQFLRALHLELPLYETIVLLTFYEIINFDLSFRVQQVGEPQNQVGKNDHQAPAEYR